MKLWVDDLRDAPDDTWTVARNSREAVALLRLTGTCEVMSLDHDLGGDDTSRVIVLWLCHESAQHWPTEVRVHTANPVGRAWLEGMIERYKPPEGQ